MRVTEEDALWTAFDQAPARFSSKSRGKSVARGVLCFHAVECIFASESVIGTALVTKRSATDAAGLEGVQVFVVTYETELTFFEINLSANGVSREAAVATRAYRGDCVVAEEGFRAFQVGEADAGRRDAMRRDGRGKRYSHEGEGKDSGHSETHGVRSRQSAWCTAKACFVPVGRETLCVAKLLTRLTL